MKNALITGITGQDGSYLAELLLKKGYRVYGIVRRVSAGRIWRIKHILDRIELISADLVDFTSIARVIERVEPDEIYHLGAQSYVAASWDQPVFTFASTALATLNLLECIRLLNKKIKFYQASSSEMFGKVKDIPQNEQTPFHPRSPYGISKLSSHWYTVNYRESFGIFACSGILFNHESSRRGIEFVTRKISYGVARIKKGLLCEICLGNLDAKRDWGYAPEYVDAMWRMMQMKEPDDYVIGTGVSHSVGDFVKLAFDFAGLNWKKYVKIDKKLKRPAEVDILIADFSKARKKLKWEPKTSFHEIVKIMVDEDIERINMGRMDEV